MGPKASESTWKFGPCECVGGKLAAEVTHTASSVVCMSKQQRTEKNGKRLSCICDETVSSELTGEGTGFLDPQVFMQTAGLWCPRSPRTMP